MEPRNRRRAADVVAPRVLRTGPNRIANESALNANAIENEIEIEGEIEIGWRLTCETWGQGYAREAAAATLAWAWSNLDAPSIAAITVPANRRSWGLMERLGMRRVVDGDFDHPDLAEGDPLRRHLTYRIQRPRP